MKYALGIVEDILSELSLRKIIAHIGGIELTSVQNACGFGKIKKNIGKYNLAARQYPIIVLTDLDRNPCLLRLKSDWLEGIEENENLLFRVVIKEIESWLIADSNNFASFLHISPALLACEIEEILDPKQFIFNLVERSRVPRYIKEGILPTQSDAKIGPNYNIILGEYITKFWNVDLARINSSSLDRTIVCFEKFRDK